MSSSQFNNNPLRADERLGTVVWPALKKIQFPLINPGDLLLVCAGFEDRATETLHKALQAGRKGFSLGIVHYLPEYQENKIEDLHRIAKGAGLKIYGPIDYNRENPAGVGEKIDYSSGKIFIDISGMSRLLIVQILVALIGKESSCPISIIYGEAETYPPSEEQFNSDNKSSNSNSEYSYLSSGIFEIAAAPELSSVSMLGEAIRLIAFPSLDHAQLTNLIQELQPTYLDLIEGVPSLECNQWRTEAIRKINHTTLNTLKGINQYSACTLNYRDTLNILLQIYKERSMFDRLVVAPTGSKMQSVAVGLFRAVLHDVQVVYPTPRVFTQPENHTSGLRQLYEISLPIEDILLCIKN